MAVRDDFAAGEVLAAADLNDTFASKVDYATPTNAQTGTAYTFVADDAELLTTASNGSAVTFTIPPQSSVTWGDDTILRVVNYGAGALTVDGGSGVTVTNTATTVAQYQAAAAIRTGSDAWTLVPFAGGDIPAAEVSSPAATGQYTDSGDTWDYYTFTASGSITVATEGVVDIAVVAGGAGGGGGNVSGQAGGGGGAGGLVVINDYFLTAATYSIVVGAGGAGVSSGFSGQGNPSGIQVIAAIGGGEASSGASGSAGRDGGSGGGAGGPGGGAGNTRSGGSGFLLQGNDGGSSDDNTSGGGGGAGGAGSLDTEGAGLSNSFTGSSVTYSTGGDGATTATGIGANGAANSGNGGGGGGRSGGVARAGGNGGSGVVIVRVKV